MKCNFDLIDEQYFVCVGCQAKFFKLPWLLGKTAVCLYPALFQIHKPQRVFVPNFMLVLHFEAILPFYSLRKSTNFENIYFILVFILINNDKLRACDKSMIQSQEINYKFKTFEKIGAYILTSQNYFFTPVSMIWKQVLILDPVPLFGTPRP